MTLRVIYRNGAFLPESECQIAEGTEAIVLLESQLESPDTSGRSRILTKVTSRMARNPLPADSPRLTRDQMHERD